MSRPSLTHQSPGRPAPSLLPQLLFWEARLAQELEVHEREQQHTRHTGQSTAPRHLPPLLATQLCHGPTGGISQHQGSRLDSAHGLKMHHVRFSFAPSQSSGSAYVLHRALSRPSRHTLPGISPRNVLARWTSICIGVKPAICENPKYEHMPSPSALSSRSTGGHCPSLYSWYGTLADWYAMRTRTDPGSSGCLLAQPVLSTAP